jgi:L-lactate dehydrogenase complex protein LldE
MKVGLFVPCYINQFYPQVAIATLQLLEKFSIDVAFPENQTCCGQPMANAGFEYLTAGCNRNFINLFSNFDYVVAPSGSCVLHLKEHLHDNDHEALAKDVRNKVFELTEFLTDIVEVKQLSARFPFQVGLHQSCHGQRGLKLVQMSELVAAPFSKPLQLLKLVKDIRLIDLERKDECCGFGGTFAVSEEAVSVKMGKDRIHDHVSHGAEYITGVDVSCLMHMEGILKRQKKNTKVIHIAEILNSTIKN